MILNFQKYHGLGNDFILIDNRENIIKTDSDNHQLSKWIESQCNRHLGIGADGIMFVENIILNEGQLTQADVRYKIFNSDGSESNICGNGLRCFTKFLILNKIVEGKKKIKISTNIGVIECEELQNGLYKNSLGKASTKLQSIPATTINGNFEEAINQKIQIDENESIYITLVSTGIPHCVIYVDDVENADVKRIGMYIQSRKDILPQSANVEFVQIIDQNTLKLRVYERGCGETMACATGACASVVSGIKNKKNGNSVRVLLRGGELQIDVSPEDLSLQVIGPAEKVFEGSILISKI